MKSSDPRTTQNTAQILEIIKKKPYSQFINGVEITYSILSKKQQDFVFSNNRFLLLKGFESISYARQLVPNTPLPFRNQTDIPAPKSSFPLIDIETFTNQQDRLIITFSGQKNSSPGLFSCQSPATKTKWEFSCPSKVCALQWRKKLEIAVARAQQFKRSRYEKYSEYNHNKSQLDEDSMTNRKQVNNLLAVSQIVDNGNSRVEAGTKTTETAKPQLNTSNFKEKDLVVFHTQKQQATSINFENYKINDEKPKPKQQTAQLEKPIQTSNIKIQQKYFNLEAQLQRPFTFVSKTSEVAKVQDILLDNNQQQPLIIKSMSDLSVGGKFKIQSQLASGRRKWIDQLIEEEQQSQLFLDFQLYVKKIVQVIINQIHLPDQSKIYPSYQRYRQYMIYELDDIELEIYLYNQQDIAAKHYRYKQRVKQFKNLDYLVEVTQNQGILKVPFMVLFDYKGFVGMAKTKIANDGIYRNREYVEYTNRNDFQTQSRINLEILLDQTKCKIVLYQKHPNAEQNIQNSRVYFVQKLLHFLPEENESKQNNLGSANLLRPELLQDQQFQNYLFFQKTARGNQREKIYSVLEQKVSELLQSLEDHTEYFTNSQELSELLHLSGISVRQLGTLYALSTQIWLKRLLQAEIAARCLKNFYRFDMQNCIMLPADHRPSKQHQSDRQIKRIINFLNLVLGNSQATVRLWQSINSYSQHHFGVSFWQEDFSSINTGYFFQALQTHLKIVLNDQVLQKQMFFRSMNTLDLNDFIRFELEVNGYNLDFTNTFQQINKYLEEEDIKYSSFEQLCAVITQTTRNGQTILELVHSQPIYQKINRFLLNFVSPDQNIQLYNKIQTAPLPSKFMYQSKLAQIKWYLKARRLQHIQKPVKFIQDNAAKWLGSVHPIYTQLSRLLAEEYAESDMMYSRAIQYAKASLQMQLSLFDGEEQPLWKDYFLLGKIHYLSHHYQDALPHLKRAKQLVKIQKLYHKQNYSELLMTLAKCYIGIKYYKDAYTTIKDLYQTIRQQKDDISLNMILESVSLIKGLLQMNQQHDSYYRFIQQDFGNIIYVFVDNQANFITALKLVAVPYLKHILLQHRQIQAKLINLLETLSKMVQAPAQSYAFLKFKIQQGQFPSNFMKNLKDIDNIMVQIESNQIMARWISFNNMANQTLLSKIGNSQINRGFQLLAYLTALFNLLSRQIIQDMFIMQN